MDESYMFKKHFAPSAASADERKREEVKKEYLGEQSGSSSGLTGDTYRLYAGDVKNEQTADPAGTGNEKKYVDSATLPRDEGIDLNEMVRTGYEKMTANDFQIVKARLEKEEKQQMLQEQIRLMQENAAAFGKGMPQKIYEDLFIKERRNVELTPGVKSTTFTGDAPTLSGPLTWVNASETVPIVHGKISKNETDSWDAQDAVDNLNKDYRDLYRIKQKDLEEMWKKLNDTRESSNRLWAERNELAKKCARLEEESNEQFGDNETINEANRRMELDLCRLRQYLGDQKFLEIVTGEKEAPVPARAPRGWDWNEMKLMR
jgi:hypothetical protein